MAGAKYFSSFDLSQGFYNIRLTDEARPKTAFTAGRLGLFEFVRTPFGCKTAPASAQRLMQLVLGSDHLQGMVIYIDNIILYTTTQSDHAEKL